MLPKLTWLLNKVITSTHWNNWWSLTQHVISKNSISYAGREIKEPTCSKNKWDISKTFQRGVLRSMFEQTNSPFLTCWFKVQAIHPYIEKKKKKNAYTVPVADLYLASLCLCSSLSQIGTALIMHLQWILSTVGFSTSGFTALAPSECHQLVGKHPREKINTIHHPARDSGAQQIKANDEKQSRSQRTLITQVHNTVP